MHETHGQLVALRQEREKTIDRLTQHFVEEHLSLDDLEARLDKAHQATSPAELDALCEDLEPLSESVRAVALPAAEVPDHGWVVAAMGGAARQGRWNVPRRLRVAAVMGGVDLDLREAALGSGMTEIQVLAVMGGVDVIVPPHVAVEVNGIGIMGAFDDQSRSTPRPATDLPRLKISGLALMGGIEVSTRLPGESTKDAQKRIEAEQKQQGHLLSEGE